MIENPYIDIIIRSVSVYLFMVIALRIFGKKELSQLTTVLEHHQAITSMGKEIVELTQQASTETNPEIIEMYQQEIASLVEQNKHQIAELTDLMYPADPFDQKDIYLEIRAGTGGQEAALFAGDLLKMYSNYAIAKGWKTQVVSLSQTDLGGIKEIILEIKGKGVYGQLKFESGVHRVQRVPQTETQGRIHTSTATVAVLPEADDVDVTISPDQLRIDYFRASGAGGQHVNTTDSAVRITHLPTNLVVSCQDERSQHKNKASAMKILQSRLLTAQKEKHEAELSVQRKGLIGKGMRSEKARTYNYPQNRITDHQADLTLKKLDVIMTGQLDEIIEALKEKERQDRVAQPFTFSS